MGDRLSILVTGGAGYLGSMMVPELLRHGHRVTVLDNFMYRQNSLTTVCADPNFQVVKGDAREGIRVEAAAARRGCGAAAGGAGRHAAMRQ